MLVQDEAQGWLRFYWILLDFIGSALLKILGQALCSPLHSDVTDRVMGLIEASFQKTSRLVD